MNEQPSQHDRENFFGGLVYPTGAKKNRGKGRGPQDSVPHSPSRLPSSIQRTAHPQPALPQHVRVNHRGGHVVVAQQFLDRPDVGASLEQRRGKRVPKRVAAHALGDPATPYGKLTVS